MSIRKSNNLAAMLAGALILIVAMMGYVLFDHYTHMQTMQSVMGKSQSTVLKIRYYSELMELARARTRLTNQILDTADTFEKDELNQELEVHAGQFARIYQALVQLPLSAYEQKRLQTQKEIVSIILPTQRKVVALSTFGASQDNQKAKALFYEVVMPGQNNLIALFQDLIAFHQENTETLIAETEIALQAGLEHQNIFAAFAVVVTLLIGGYVVLRTRTTQNFLELERRSLEQVVEKRTAQLTKARDEAEHANRAKSEFLSSMSHELRTPMNAILGFGQMLEFNPQEPLTDAQKECVHHIMKGGNHLLELINDVLDLVKIEAGKVELSVEPIAPMSVVGECLPLISALADKRGINLNFPSSEVTHPKVRADFTRLKQVLLNLLSNAVKYNRTGGSITLSVQDVDHDRLRISVSDTGNGIPVDQQKSLFTPFNRLDAANSEIEGTGIGLVITKDLIELMQGEIGFESEPGRGSTFWIELPISQDIPDLDHGTNLQGGAQGGAVLPSIQGRLLYVEDNPDNLKLMELVVARIHGLTMISAHNGELGLELARSEKPDLIILDINLPGMSGLDVVRELRQDAQMAGVPVLALSAAATKRDIEKGMAAGFNQYLTKPIVVPEVVAAIEASLVDHDGGQA